ncbi:alpha-L-fucosidase [Mycetocola sp. BIGb0189]|uniref:alpha-L-fucosidase n=1 Tax=Mycetocola sp. BIGb0189 TaxID=2940604 RepID=UPI00216A6904|nr:alpha-L-fucosidase [Mycetocola sp. BIGb0189]MCS4277115.1 alpha-L-fucosidase [Mycetocola sp. BIGb0189]
MAMFQDNPVRPDNYARFERPTPAWFSGAKLGIFVHWGPYSVPAWGEPIGALGTIEKTHWFKHNPYAEWYFNTIRIEGSPAAEHQKTVYGGAPYDDFIDAWKAENFDADAVLDLVRRTGARYFVPTTKHHDGVTLWDAPGTNGRNTVARGPRRDLIGEFADATRKAGLRFGVYYSGGLDWHFRPEIPPIANEEEDLRPLDAGYAEYAYHHVDDLLDRYAPDVLWGDIEWPDAGKPSGPFSMENLFEKFYTLRPDGVSNDRWGETHWDYRTSEYEHGRGAEGDGQAWENCRGVGYSFGFNQLEDASHLLSGPDAAANFIDIVARGGNFLLNIGLTASGEVPEGQRETLEHLGAWNDLNGHAVFDSEPYSAGGNRDEPWVRWTRTGNTVHAFIGSPGEVVLGGLPAEIVLSTARDAHGTPVSAEATAEGARILVPVPEVAGPVLVSFDLSAA